MKPLVAIYSLLLALVTEGYTQPVTVEARTLIGFIAPHRSGMKHLVTGHVRTLELGCQFPTYGKKAWQRLYNYPAWGVMAHYADLGNPTQLGTALGVYPYFKFPLVQKQWFKFNYRVGWGIVYLTKAFDRVENYKNNAIGSDLNAIIAMQMGVELRVTRRLGLTAGIGFSHYSNGAYRAPNLGLNMPAVNTGLDYILGTIPNKVGRDTLTHDKGNYDVVMFASFGIKELSPAGGKKYGAYTLSGEIGKVLSYRGKIVGGIDLFYNSSYSRLLAEDKDDHVSAGEIMQVGLSAHYEILVSRIAICLGLGGYLKTDYTERGYLYTRIGTRVDLTDRIVAKVALKTHWFRADYMEFGIGYRILKK